MGEEVRKELGRVISPKRAEYILKTIGMRGTPSSMLKGLPELEKSTFADQGVNELRELISLCKVYGIARFIEIDFSHYFQGVRIPWSSCPRAARSALRQRMKLSSPSGDGHSFTSSPSLTCCQSVLSNSCSRRFSWLLGVPTM